MASCSIVEHREASRSETGPTVEPEVPPEVPGHVPDELTEEDVCEDILRHVKEFLLVVRERRRRTLLATNQLSVGGRLHVTTLLLGSHGRQRRKRLLTGCQARFLTETAATLQGAAGGIEKGETSHTA